MLDGRTITVNELCSQKIPMDQQTLLLNSRILEDHRMLSFYGIKKESTLRMTSTLSGIQGPQKGPPPRNAC
eukprot:13425565-Heterocapsa_arctica.AAC.1